MDFSLRNMDVNETASARIGTDDGLCKGKNQQAAKVSTISLTSKYWLPETSCIRDPSKRWLEYLDVSWYLYIWSMLIHFDPYWSILILTSLKLLSLHLQFLFHGIVCKNGCTLSSAIPQSSAAPCVAQQEAIDSLAGFHPAVVSSHPRGHTKKITAKNYKHQQEQLQESRESITRYFGCSCFQVTGPLILRPVDGSPEKKSACGRRSHSNSSNRRISGKFSRGMCFGAERCGCVDFP